MAFVVRPRLQDGDNIVNIEEKLFPDYKAEPGSKALVLMHTVPYEGSVGLINMLTTTRLARKGFQTTMFLYGPGVLMGSSSRGFPAVGQEGFPGALAMNNQLKVILKEGSKIYACRFAMAMLYGHREEDMIEGIQPAHPLDLLDCVIENWKGGALVVNTWTV
jgi:uncharacterized repeat protein (TIGR04044 family)